MLTIVRANSRSPIEAEGDVYSLVACNDTGCERLCAMLEEFDLDDLESLAEHIVTRSREAVLDQVRPLPRGTYRNAMTLDGYDQPIELVAALTVADDGIHVDCAGTSPVSRFGINVPRTYCAAYTGFGLACAIAPEVPNNAGSLGVFHVSAPEGCILNAPYPSPVATRHVIGHMLPDVVFGCLDQAMPGRVPPKARLPLDPDHGAERRRPARQRHAIRAQRRAQRRHRCPAARRRAVRDRLSLGRARHAGRDHRIDLTSCSTVAGSCGQARAESDAPERVSARSSKSRLWTKRHSGSGRRSIASSTPAGPVRRRFR